LSGREARNIGLVDRAFCERRARIELRTFLDELERSPRVIKRSRDLIGLAQERRAFAKNWSPTRKQGCTYTLAWASGSRLALTPAGAAGSNHISIVNALARGFITPLEAEQMRSRIAAIPAPPLASRPVSELELAAA
ncbi:MAG TPA: hypothetical protein VGL71_14090, partial [Urbifossiella sp.]